jgi:dTDP-4-amino-4,6-dideoxy-D-galactose acyltransferase
LLTGIKHLDWDSRFFGFQVGSAVTFPDDNGWLASLKNENLRLVYFLIDPEDTSSLINAENYGAIRVDTKINYSLDLSKNHAIFPDVPEGLEVEAYEKDEVEPKLFDLAFQSGEYSRFRLDHNIPEQKFIDLYSLWIARSVKHEMADQVLVVRSEKEIAAMATLSVDLLKARIGLFAVDRVYQGRKIGKLLMNHLVNNCTGQGLSFLDVPTQQENKAACRFYEACGFLPVKTTCIFHLWL